MVIAEYEGYGLSFKDIWKEVKKGLRKVARVAIPLYVGKMVGFPEKELEQALVLKELERSRKIRVPETVPRAQVSPSPPPAPASVPAVSPPPPPPSPKTDTMQQLMPYLILGIPMVISLILILRRR